MTIDLQHYWGKLARREAISEDEIVALLKEVAHLRTTVGYLASCHAATLESLPKSSSKSARGRMVSICDTAAKALRGDISAIKYPSRDIEVDIDRCERAVDQYRLDKPAT